ncbi:MAG: 4-oxalocrotonate tautomerase [Candidatus Verstraetearchaeota archaeon]|jgi:4-oxalocrotonate tautomerase|nr:4-oxalocrotonate tautomerase [Candidatus Verstraetearchaeota archaeon]
MPVVNVYVWKGFSDEAKRKTIEGITKVFTDIGIPKEAVEVIIIEVPKESWGIAGLPASEKLREVSTP